MIDPRLGRRLASLARIGSWLVAIPTWIWAALASVVFLGSAAIRLTEYPPVYADEPWDLSAPIALIRTGQLALPMFGESYSGAPYYNVYLAVLLGISGVDIGAARLITVIHGAALVFVTFLIARELGLGRAAFVPTLMVPFLFPFTELSRYVRPDTISALWGFIAVWLAMVGKRDGRLHFAAGMSAALATAIFPVGIWAPLVIGAIAAARRDLRALAQLTAGASLALLPLLIFIARDPMEFTRFFVKFGGSSLFTRRASGLPEAVILALTSEPQRYASFYDWAGTWLYPLTVAAAMALGIGIALRRRAWRLLALLVIPALVLSTLAYNKTPAYFAVLAVPVAVLVGAFVRASPRFGAALVIILTLGYVTTVSARTANVATDQRAIAAAYANAFITRHPAVLIGSPVVYAYFLRDTDIEFRAFQVFCRFEDLRLDSADANMTKLAALSRGRPIFVVFEEATFFGEMRQFDPDRSRSEEFARFIRERFVPEATLNFKSTPYGDYSVTIARYVAP